LFAFDKFCRLVGIKLIINVLKYYYHLDAGIDGGNDVH